MAENIPVLQRQLQDNMTAPKSGDLSFIPNDAARFTQAATRAVAVLSQAEQEQRIQAQKNAQQQRVITHYRLKSEIAKRFGDLEAKYSADPAAIEQNAAILRQDIVKNIPDPELNAMVGYEIDTRTLGAVGQATANQAAKQDYDTEVATREYVTGAMQRIQTRAGQLFRLPESQRATASTEMLQDLYGISTAYAATGVNGRPLFTPLQTVNGTQAALSGMYNSAIAGWVDAQPDKTAAYNQLVSGKLTLNLPDGKGGVSPINVLDVADPETVNFAKAQAAAVASEQRARQSAATKEFESEFELGLAQAENNPQGLAALKERLDANRSALTEPGKYNQLLTKIVKATNRVEDGYKEVQLGADILSTRAPVNPADSQSVKAVDAYYEKVMVPKMTALPMETRMAMNAEIVATTRVIPRYLSGALKSAATSQRPEDVIEAARLIDTIGARNPQLLEQFDSSSFTRIRMVDALIKDGTPPVEAVGKADELTNPTNRPVIEARLKTAREAKIDYTDKAKKIFTSRIPFSGARYGAENTEEARVDDKVTAAMGAQYKDVYETEFKLSGNTKLAEEAAERAIRGKYGRTTINGRRQVTIYPPEQSYALPGDSEEETSKWIRGQINEDIKPHLEEFKKVNGLGEDFNPDKDILVVPDPVFTPKTASVGRPEYRLQAFDKDGILVDILPPGQRFFADPKKEMDARLSKAASKRDPSRLPDTTTVNKRLDYAPY